MEFLWPILAKIELICQQTQVSGVNPSSGVPERMTGGWWGGLAMKRHCVSTCAENIVFQHKTNFCVNVECMVRFPCVWLCFIFVSFEFTLGSCVFTLSLHCFNSVFDGSGLFVPKVSLPWSTAERTQASTLPRPHNTWQQWHRHSPHRSTAYHLSSRKWLPHQAWCRRHPLQSQFGHQWAETHPYIWGRHSFSRQPVA